MTPIMTALLKSLGLHPVLLDIGASGASPQIWDALKKHSIYIGFDPDARDFQVSESGQFYKTYTVNKAIVERPVPEVDFYFTLSPYCSSVLLPDAASLSEYAFADLFLVTGKGKAKATTLDAMAGEYGFSGFDWIKTDTQGTDLRLFTSMSEELRKGVLAVDMEPGIMDAYIGEDLFVDVQKEMTKQGFWLSHMQVKGSSKIRRSTMRAMRERYAIPEEAWAGSLRQTPCWAELRYLRSLDWLAENVHDPAKYVLLWIFSVLDEQFGFSLDIGLEYERRFGKDSVSELLVKGLVQHIARS